MELAGQGCEAIRHRLQIRANFVQVGSGHRLEAPTAILPLVRLNFRKDRGDIRQAIDPGVRVGAHELVDADRVPSMVVGPELQGRVVAESVPEDRRDSLGAVHRLPPGVAREAPVAPVEDHDPLRGGLFLHAVDREDTVEAPSLGLGQERDKRLPPARGGSLKAARRDLHASVSTLLSR